MSTRVSDTIDTLLWLGAGLVAAAVAPVLLLVGRLWPGLTNRHPEI